MTRPAIETFVSSDVDAAREEILQYLQQERNTKVFYLDGWNGFGASAVLKSIAEELPSRRTTPELCFDRIIYIDCSEWKSDREMQRVIAEELRLERSVMAFFDKQDEEDDFAGVNEGSRGVILRASEVIHQTLISHRFMMIFLNGSDDEVDVTRFGIPQFTDFCKNIMIWTFNRSSCLTMHLHYSAVASKQRYTQAFFHSSCIILTSSWFRGLLHREAATIVSRNPHMLDVNPRIIADCCLYELFLHCSFHRATKFDWVPHASNYWICDTIIQGDIARDIINALQREINWKCYAPLKNWESPFLVIKNDDVYVEGPYRWISVTSRNTGVHGMQTIPATASSFFLAFERSDHSPTLPNGFFKDSSKLGVLILYCCAFSFASPPFLKCNSLRFLGLDNCSNDKTIQAEDDTAEWSCLYSLWVLDLRYTDWNEILSEEKLDLMTNIRELNIEGIRSWQYAALLQGRISNLQRLRIIKPTCRSEGSKDADNSFTDKTSMEILDLSGNRDMEILPISLSKASRLEMLVLDGCDGLENVASPSRLPPSLKSFSFYNLLVFSASEFHASTTLDKGR